MRGYSSIKGQFWRCFSRGHVEKNVIVCGREIETVSGVKACMDIGIRDTRRFLLIGQAQSYTGEDRGPCFIQTDILEVSEPMYLP